MTTIRFLGITGGILSLTAALFCARYFIINRNDDQELIPPTASPEHKLSQVQKLTRVDPVQVRN